MHPSITQSLCSPPAYTRLERLFDSEKGSDVTFLVGVEPETWRFPGHRSVLSKANPVFKAMLAATQASTIPITDVDSRAFDLLLRYLYNEEVLLQSVNTALCTFYAAQKYMCTGLMTECILYLDQNLNPGNVLQVYQDMRIHSGQYEEQKRGSRVDEDPWAPSAPPYHRLFQNDKDPNDNFDSTLGLCSTLLHNCLCYIDRHADRVLAEESIEDLSPESLKELLERDTLYVSSENSVYFALERWCNRECKRRQLEMSHDSRRFVLEDDLLFSVRFLNMTQKEFYTGPMSGDLLDKKEATVLVGQIMGIQVPNSAYTLDETIIRKIREPRRRPTAQELSIIGRGRKNYSGKDLGDKPQPKKQKKQRRKEKDKDESRRRCTGSCVTDCVFRALSCLFD